MRILMKLDSTDASGKVDKMLKDRSMVGVGNSFVGSIGIVLVTIYLILLSALLLYSLINFWPSDKQVSDAQIFIIVILAGALGGLVHALWSFYWYAGNRELRWSWIPMYILLPFVGATLGVTVYLIVRGGFFSLQATGEQTATSFAALGALSGMLSRQIMNRLHREAQQKLSEAPIGKDSVSHAYNEAPDKD